jgi:ADP-ribosylglycohydrolase
MCLDRKEHLQRACLSLEGLSIGDAFGQQLFRHVSAMRIPYRELPPPPWPYTDDTMMAVAIVDVLSHDGSIDQDELAATFAKLFTLQPTRGYGAGAVKLLAALAEGTDWREASSKLFGGSGSRGNGAAMRAGPIGAYFAYDLPTVVAEARKSAEVTHAHEDGIAGAIAVAVAAAQAHRLRAKSALGDGRSVLDLAFVHTPDSPTREGLSLARTVPPSWAIQDVAAMLGSGFDVLSADTVPFAIWCAAHHLNSFEDALWKTVEGLGDMDTTCAMVGSIVAPAVGADNLPQEWINRREPLENAYLDPRG